MRLITGFLFLLNLLIWIAFDVICWYLTGVTMGLIVLIGIIGFLIAWGLSGEAVIAPFDYLAQPEWDIFKIKLKWSNTVCFTVMGIFGLICIVMDWLDLRTFLDIQM